MPSASHHFVADRPIDAVFDVVTTARFWPAWHPATRGVEGDVDHPAQLGDQIIEHVTIAGVDGSGTWTVVEYDRPYHLALETCLAVVTCGSATSWLPWTAEVHGSSATWTSPNWGHRSVPPCRRSLRKGSPASPASWNARSRSRASPHGQGLRRPAPGKAPAKPPTRRCVPGPRPAGPRQRSVKVGRGPQRQRCCHGRSPACDSSRRACAGVVPGPGAAARAGEVPSGKRPG